MQMSIFFAFSLMCSEDQRQFYLAWEKVDYLVISKKMKIVQW
jgi:hypothetical protein